MMVQLAYYNDQNPVVDFLVGHICRRLNMAEAAAEAFIAAISKAENPVFKAVVYDHLGETLLDLGQYSEALATAQEAIALTPGHPLPYYNQAIALLRLNDPKAAQAAMEAAVEKGLTEPEMTTARSLLQEKKNEALAGQP